MIVLVTILAIIAAWFDVRKNIIPNRLLFSGMGIGILLRTTIDIFDGNPLDILIMIAEVIVLFICLWPVYSTGGLGAGDCKLLMLAGAFLPVNQAVFIVVYTFFIAAAEIILWKLVCKIRREKKEIRSIHVAPVFLMAVLTGWL